jgi:hypothetical protein
MELIEQPAAYLTSLAIPLGLQATVSGSCALRELAHPQSSSHPPMENRPRVGQNWNEGDT